MIMATKVRNKAAPWAEELAAMRIENLQMRATIEKLFGRLDDLQIPPTHPPVPYTTSSSDQYTPLGFHASARTQPRSMTTPNHFGSTTMPHQPGYLPYAAPYHYGPPAYHYQYPPPPLFHQFPPTPPPEFHSPRYAQGLQLQHHTTTPWAKDDQHSSTVKSGHHLDYDMPVAATIPNGNAVTERLAPVYSEVQKNRLDHSLPPPSVLKNAEKKVEHVLKIERESAEEKKELQEERDSSRTFTMAREEGVNNVMRQVGEIGKQLSDALRATSAAEARTSVAEARYQDLEEVDPCVDLTDDYIRTVIRNSTGPRSASFVPEVPFEVFVRKKIARVLGPSLQCARFNYGELVEISRRCMVSDLRRFPVLRRHVDEIVDTSLMSKYGELGCLHAVGNVFGVMPASFKVLHDEVRETDTIVADFESCIVAVARQRGIDMVLNDESKRETPAIICFGDKLRFIGTAGAATTMTNPKNTVSQIKRLIGRNLRRFCTAATTEAPDAASISALEALAKLRTKHDPGKVLKIYSSVPDHNSSLLFRRCAQDLAIKRMAVSHRFPDIESLIESRNSEPQIIKEASLSTMIRSYGVVAQCKFYKSVPKLFGELPAEYGEIYVQLQESVRGCDVYLVQPACPSANEKLMELLIMVDAYRRTLAKTVTAQEVAGNVRMIDKSLKSYKGVRNGNERLINRVDSPGHIDFSSEVTAALRIIAGALVVEGICAHTETVLRQALKERIRPVSTINKMDRCFLELQVYPEKGTVAFSADSHGWPVTLTNFAKMYASRFGIDESKMRERLWGENFFDPATKKWTAKNTGSATCKRGFVQFCYVPIKQIIKTCLNDQKDKLWPMLQKLGVSMKGDENELTGKPLMKRVMQTWLLANTALLEMMIVHLPSPATDRRYRVENLYQGPLDDVYANALRNCDPDGPLILYVSKMIPASDKGRFFAFGRVFAGKVPTGLKVRIMGPGEKKDLYNKSVQRAVSWIGKRQEIVEDVLCGITVVMVGLAQYFTKNATLTNEEEVDAHLVRTLTFPVSLVVQIAVQCKVASDLPKLVEGLKHLAKLDSMVVVCSIEESGEHTIAGAGERHLEICLKELVDDVMGGALEEGNRRGICFEVGDVVLHANAIHRDGGQVIPTARRVIYASQLTAKPRLLEPVYLVEIQDSEQALGEIHSILNQKSGHVFEEMQRQGTPLHYIKAYLPVVELFAEVLDEDQKHHVSKNTASQKMKLASSIPNLDFPSNGILLPVAPLTACPFVGSSDRDVASKTDATWEELDAFQDEFPGFNLEVEVCSEEGGNDKDRLKLAQQDMEKSNSRQEQGRRISARLKRRTTRHPEDTFHSRFKPHQSTRRIQNMRSTNLITAKV